MKKKLISTYFLLAFVFTTNAQWSLTGNSGTNPPTNFIGTTDAKNLVFKANNLQAGIIDLPYLNSGWGYLSLYTNTTGSYNTANGYQSLYSNTTGSYNTSIGHQSLYSNTNSTGNTACGYASLRFNTTGSNNSSIGTNSMYNNTDGTYNVALGNNALYSNTLGYSNTALGVNTLFSNSMGYSNVGIGLAALYSNTTTSNLVAIGDSSLYNNYGGSNTAVGSKTLYSNTYGYRNTALGYQALYSNTTGFDNTAVGETSLYSNTTGIYNTAIGEYSMYKNIDGHSNSSVGYRSMYNVTSGIGNVAMGIVALKNLTTGNYNTSVGNQSLNLLYTGEYNTALGWGANWNNNTPQYNNTTVLGSNAIVTASNQIRLGDNSVTSIGGYANWTNISDGRVKKNIAANVPGLVFINKLIPVTYNLDLAAADKIIQPQPATDKDGNAINTSETLLNARKEKEKIVYSGFIAQDVEKAAKDLKFNFSGIDAAKNDKDLYGLRYAEFVVPLVKAVQELSNANDSLKAQISTLQEQMQAILLQLNGNKANTNVALNGDAPYIQQNIPNPFNNKTIINYYLPSTISNAQIIIHDVSGKQLKTISSLAKGMGQITINAQDLPTGNYFYTLFADGNKVDSKQMVFTK